MQKITSIELKNDKNGNPMKVTVFDNGAKVYVNSKYDETIYEKVVEGAEFELIKDGNFDKIKYEKPAPTRNAGAGVAKMMEKKEASIEKFQDKKEAVIEKMACFRDATLLTQVWASKQDFLVESAIQEKWTMFHKWLQGKMDEPFS